MFTYIGTMAKRANLEPASPPDPDARDGRMTLALPNHLIDKVRDAAFWSRQTLADIGSRAILAELQKMERANRGAIPEAVRPDSEGTPDPMNLWEKMTRRCGDGISRRSAAWLG